MNESSLGSFMMLAAIHEAMGRMARLPEARTFRVERLAPYKYQVNTSFSDGSYDQIILTFDPITLTWGESR